MTIIKKCNKLAKVLRQAEEAGVVGSFALWVEDSNEDIFADGSADMQGFFQQSCGLSRVLADKRTGLYSAPKGDQSEIIRLQSLFPTCGTVLSNLNTAEMRHLLRHLEWNTVRKAFLQGKLPQHMLKLHSPGSIVYKPLPQEQHQHSSSSAEQSSSDSSAANTASSSTSIHSNPLGNTAQKKNIRNSQGKFQHSICDHDAVFSMSTWEVLPEGHQLPARHITLKELTGKSANLLTCTECVAALGITLEFHNPGTYMCCW